MAFQMLKCASFNSTAFARHSRTQSCRKSRLPVCRSAEHEASTRVVTVERPVVDEDVKMKATLSTLDSLLGSQDLVPSTSSRASSSIGTSTSRPAPAAPVKQQQQGFKLPSLPLASDSSSSSGQVRRKPTGLTFDQVMGFSGLAPEVINGRAAMIGFLLAITAELKTGESVFAQMVSGGAAQALVVILAITVASFAPVIRGTPLDEVFNKAPKKQPTEWGPFTAAAEGLNGRLAMVGIGLLLFFEGAGSTAFFLN